MNKKLLILMNVMIVSVALHGMEIDSQKRSTDIQLKNLRRTQTAEGTESRAHDNREIRLNLDSLPEQPLFSSANGKQSVKSLNQVNHLKNQQTTFRSETARGSSGSPSTRVRTSQNNNLVVQNDDEHKNEILVNNKELRGIEDLSSNNYFSEQDLWDLLKKANPRMYTYAIENKLLIGDVKNCPYNLDTIDPAIYSALMQLAKKKSLSLDQMMEYVHLLDSFDIGPEALGDLLQKQHNNLSNDDIKLVVQKLGSIQKNNKEQYLALALDFLTRTLDEDGLKEPSPIHAAHVAIQNDAIANEKQQKIYSLIALGLTLATSLAGYAWAIYGQVSGTNTNAPTGAPTHSPTNAPTMFPTGSPI